MSKLYRNAAIAAAAVGAGIFLIPSSKKSVPLETFGTQNIANAYSRGGGSDTHLPGIATTRGQGKAEETMSKQINPKGVDTKHFVENVADQKADDKSGPEKALTKMAYGQEKGK
ncbi:hypothetical protein CLAFUW4_10346 [Fulvia fulva]|uniref:Uncharacterized protein n=1 Tax=Passalora fulva TaxID=5499 RepID=A0A9Q8LF00_PASFU|nr:uncharacterized protein CLAFUR5_04961 [Fulvia fulva]KAK4616275.1 hypothetical protein CLAFUR4_10350 [Fulvia fulva]KAK4617082.1 hypothetical protein CLAFUR0_10350 [Fulvia fulva]UJO16222.1 hypothetical protein CLAFUR5_04961 [Fulvia fulva]WPV19316.1 hypothetical protein CLAFUW4_10346 [Fulvia fulva]WPV33948.1 hypothetical protein CLAFUW7_10346 [Fulvia fulva]